MGLQAGLGQSLRPFRHHALWVPSSSAAATYDSTVLSDSPAYFWETKETSGTNAADSADSNAGTYNGTITLAQAGPTQIGNAGITLNGVSTTFLSTATSYSEPTTYSTGVAMEIWFKTAGTLQAIADTNAGDINLYVDGTGHLVFRLWTGSAVTISSTGTFNDGNWHQAGVSLAANWNMTLYADGASVASNANVTAPAAATGNWRFGHADGAGLGTASLTGSLSSPSVYATALSGARFLAHYNAGH